MFPRWYEHIFKRKSILFFFNIHGKPIVFAFEFVLEIFEMSQLDMLLEICLLKRIRLILND